MGKGSAMTFHKVAAWVAANLPGALAQNITLSSEWYNGNGFYKFKVGETIDCKGPQYFGYGLNPQGWVVKGHKRDEARAGDMYVIETAEGEEQIHFKWNIENHFKISNPNAKPFDPDRFTFGRKTLD